MEYHSQSKQESRGADNQELLTQPASPIEQAFSPAPELQRQQLKQSGPGIASFIISLVTIAGYITAAIILGTIASTAWNNHDNLMSNASQVVMNTALAILGLSAVNVIGVVVGIIGLSLRNRRKVLAAIGTIMNGLIVLCFMMLFAVFFASAGGN